MYDPVVYSLYEDDLLKYSLRLCLKADKVFNSLICMGRLFQTVGPLYVKLRLKSSVCGKGTNKLLFVALLVLLVRKLNLEVK